MMESDPMPPSSAKVTNQFLSEEKKSKYHISSILHIQ